MMNSLEVIRTNISLLKQCGICGNTCSEPRTLDCLHSFCLECIKSLCDLKCPCCNVEIIPPDGAAVDMFFEYLKSNALFSEDSTYPRNEFGDIGCRKHPLYTCKYYYSDSLDLACDICRNDRVNCCEDLTQEAANKIRNKHHDDLNKTISNTEHELKEINSKLCSQENDMLSKNDDIILGVMKYFIDLKTQINEYLIKLEKQVLEKLKVFTGNEMSKIVTFSKQCLAMLQSVESKFTFLSQPFPDAEQSEALSTVSELSLLTSHLDEYFTKAKKVKSVIRDETDIRFVINTEFEDMLTGGDLIDIEIINSEARSSAYVDQSVSDSMPSVSEINQHADGSTTESRETISVNTAETTTPTVRPTITVTPPDNSEEYDDDPPPPYPGLSIDISTTAEQNQAEYFEEQATGPQQTTPSAPVLDDLYDLDNAFTSPVVPRGLRHMFDREPISPPGTVNDNHILKIRPIFKFKINTPGQRSIPNLVHICWINEDSLVALDKRNKSARIYSDRGININGCTFQNEPFSCTVYKARYSSDYTMAVVFPKEKKLRLFNLSVDDNFRISKTQEVDTKKGYTCITYSDSKRTFICATTSPFAMPAVDLLDRNCNYLISFSGSSNVPFGYPRSIQINQQSIIAISDYKTSRVVFMDMEGKHQGFFSGTNNRKLGDPQGIGFCERLGVFVIADTRANRLFVVDFTGSMYDYFGENALLENTPRFIDFSRSETPQLAIGHGSGYISLYKVMNTISPAVSFV